MKRIFKLFVAAVTMIIMAGITTATAQVTDSLVTVDGVNYIISNGKATLPASSTNGGQGGVYSGNLVIPAYIEVDGAYYDVTRVESHAFYHNEDLESVTFQGTSLDYIGPAAFQGCTNLHTLTLTENLADMGEWTFADCPKLQTIKVPEGVTTIYNSVFKNCSELYEITIPSSVTTFAIDAFANDKAISVVYLNAAEPPSNSQSPINADNAVVVVPDEFVGNYNATWGGAIVKSKTDYESPTNKSTLKSFIDRISESGQSYEGGITPGTYPQTKVDAFESALMSAMLMLEEEHSEDEYLEAYNNLVALQQDLEKSVNPITEGYYRIVSAYPGFVNRQSVEKAMTVNEGDILGWATLNESDPTQIFKITPIGSNYSIQNYSTNTYIKSSKTIDSSQPVYMSVEQTTAQTITPIGALQYLIANSFCNISYHPEGHSYGGGNKGNIVTWNDNDINGMSTWYLRYIGTEVPDSIADAKRQANINSELTSLINESNELKAKTLTFIKSGNLITEANDSIPEQNQFSSNAKDPAEGTYGALIDGNTDGTVFFHSTWHDDPGVPHYLQVNLRSNKVQEFDLLLARRSGYYGGMDAPDQVKLEATNDTTSWDSITTLTIAWDGNATSQAQTISDINLGSSYQYLRFTVLHTVGNRTNAGQTHPFFSISEFQINGLTVDQQHSQYYYINGMKAAVDNMSAAAMAGQAALLNNAATQTEVDNLQKAVDAVKSLYVDTVALNTAIALGENYLNTTEVGDKLGQTSQEAKDALQAVINEVKNTSTSEPLIKADVDAAISKMNAANTTFARSIHTVVPDTWYYISSTSQYREGAAGEDDAACKDQVIYTSGANNTNNLMWGLNVEESQSFLYDAHAMWRFIPVANSDNYYIQNLGTGFYMGPSNGDQANIKVSYEPVAYKVNSLGGGQFELVPTNDGNTLPLHAKGSNNNIVAYNDGGANSASSWTFLSVKELNVDEMIVMPYRNNYTDILCLPFNFSAKTVAEVNSDVHFYAIKKITQEQNDTALVSTIELYEKDEFAAGEPCILFSGEPIPGQESEDVDIIFPFPTSVTTSPINGNGISGCLHGQGYSAGVAYSTGTDYVVAKDGVGIGAQTGAIDPATYRGEVEGVTAADKQLVLVGLNAIPTGNKADVNGDGQVNSADVAVVYNFIANGANSGYTEDTLDVNGDGSINTSDVAYIYGQIAGGDAASKAYVKKILRLLEGK